MELQENLLNDIEAAEREASPAQKILSNIIDIVLEMGIVFLFYKFLPKDMRALLIRNKQVATYIVVFALFSTYRLLTILLLQRTIGMIICGTKYLTEKLQPLSSREKIIVTFSTMSGKIKIFKV